MTRVVTVTAVQEWLGVQVAKYRRQAEACEMQARRCRDKGGEIPALRWTARRMVLEQVAIDLQDAMVDIEHLRSSAYQS